MVLDFLTLLGNSILYRRILEEFLFHRNMSLQGMPRNEIQHTGS
jgi:hypothetical protein